MIAYLVTNKINGKRYIGISKEQTPNKRWAIHIQHSRWPNKNGTFGWLQQAIVKYGAEAFSVEHIASARTWADISATEVALIAQYGTFGIGLGYNMTRGGDGCIGRIATEESKQKRSASLKGRVHTPEARAKISAALKGRPSPTKGLPSRISPDGRARIIAASTGRPSATKGIPRSVELKAAVSAANKGRQRTPEWCAAHSKAMTGRVLSMDTRHKQSAAALKREEAIRSNPEIREAINAKLRAAWDQRKADAFNNGNQMVMPL